jgi:hypothetical protein
MSKVTVYDPVIVLGETGARRLLCLTGVGQARLSKGMAEFITQGLQEQELKKLAEKGTNENHSQNQLRT